MINLNNVPVEPTVTILNPDGSELVTTNDINTLFYVRVCVKRNKLSGYKIKTHTGYIVDIDTNGRISCWPNDEIPSCEYDKLLIELI
jgi:hypothetical protein